MKVYEIGIPGHPDCTVWIAIDPDLEIKMVQEEGYYCKQRHNLVKKSQNFLIDFIIKKKGD